MSHTYTLREAARLLNLGPIKLFRALRARQVLDNNNLPYRRYVADGYFVTRMGHTPTPIGDKAYGQALVTGKGLQWLRREFAEQIAMESTQ